MKRLPFALATALAGLGGAFAVYGSYDDSPGGTLIGFVVVCAAIAFNTRRAGQ